MFGGESSEHDVSVMSAHNVYAALDDDKYEVLIAYIDQEGKWWLLDSWREDLDDHSGVQIAPVLGAGSLMTVPDNKVIDIDVVFPVMHGENGHEDGAVQGLMSLTHIPVVGSGIGASAVCWDKLYAKQILSSGGIAVTPYVAYQQGQPLPDYDTLAENFGGSMFVKPATAGSSVGVSRVDSASQLEGAIDEALKSARTVLIEQAIIGRELEVAVLGTPPNHRISGVGEVIPGGEFYSYEDKYSIGSRAQVVPEADISNSMRESLRQIAGQAFLLLGCQGLARVDFLVGNSGGIYVNEINTLPGFTNISQYPKLWQQSGISYPELIDEIIADALG